MAGVGRQPRLSREDFVSRLGTILRVLDLECDEGSHLLDHYVFGRGRLAGVEVEDVMEVPKTLRRGQGGA